MAARSILFVDHAPALGGAEQSLLLLMRHLDWSHWQPHLVGVEGALLHAAQREGVPTHPIHLPRLRRSPAFLLHWLQTGQAVAQIARAVKASIIHSNTVRAAFYAALASQLAGLPFVWHMRDFWLSEAKPQWLWADRWGKQLLCTRAARVVANSQTVAASLPCSYKTTIIYNGVDVETFNPAQEGQSFRQQYALPAGVPLVGMVGRLRPWKGQDRFVRMAYKVVDQHPTVHFVIIGGDPFEVNDGYTHQLRQLCHDLQVQHRVTFVGHLHDVRPALAALDIFVHPGEPEPFGLVNVEAMAMGKPVVAFAHGALPEVVVDAVTGLLVPPLDEDGLAKAILQLLAVPEQGLQMGAAGRRRAETAFAIQRVAAEVAGVYATIL